MTAKTSPNVDELIETLVKEASIFESYFDLLEEQKGMIVANDIEGLNAVTEKQREKLTESKILDRRRKSLVEELTARNNIKGDVNVSRLLEMISIQDGSRLESLRKEITEINERIETARDQNKFLLDKSRQIVIDTIRLINRAGISSVDGAAYSPAKTAQNTIANQNQMSLTLDRRV
ncbi:MAG: flagellar protein FlgN [candidate division Zixibacteria bacterium]|nr:flagellar protein FlgN [candidate division Zixibacteria bacterium]